MGWATWRAGARAAALGCWALACGAPRGESPAPAAPAPAAEPAAVQPQVAKTPFAAEAATLVAGGPPAAFRTATGTLKAYDAAARVLTIEAATGFSRYRVADDARAWLGVQRLKLAQLPSHLGAQATVAFAEDGDGVRTTHTVRLADAGRSARRP